MAKTVLIITVSVFVTALLVLGVMGCVKIHSRKPCKAAHASKRTSAAKKMETTKKVIWVCLINGFAWVWCSYILAYLDKVQIAESLSQVAVTEIIGVVLAYCIKSAVENLSKNNHWPDKTVFPPSDADQNGGSDNA